jgi:hypothetical protein
LFDLHIRYLIEGIVRDAAPADEPAAATGPAKRAKQRATRR